MRGTLLNTATVATGATIGLLGGSAIPESYKTVALSGLGLVTIAIGVKMFLKTENPLIPAASIALGGVLGLLIGIHAGIDSLATWMKGVLPGDLGRFNEGLITTFVLFCIGPMTILGCIRDGLERNIDLLALKSTMDGIGAVFLAASFGVSVLVCALLVFVFQGAITLCAGKLRALTDHPDRLDELTATGGAILLGTGIGLLGLKDLHTANYLPALVLAPVFTSLASRWMRRPA